MSVCLGGKDKSQACTRVVNIHKNGEILKTFKYIKQVFKVIRFKLSLGTRIRAGMFSYYGNSVHLIIIKSLLTEIDIIKCF